VLWKDEDVCLSYDALMSRANNIYVAIYIADLHMPWVNSLKEKRAMILPVTEKLKVRFPVSVARLDGLNSHDWERIGVTSLHHEYGWLESLLNKVHDFVVSNGSYEVKVIDKAVEMWEVPE
jgi:uncharacterized protein YlxP (DUF503 family)